jgi:hypothetical protein
MPGCRTGLGLIAQSCRYVESWTTIGFPDQPVNSHTATGHVLDFVRYPGKATE